mmetsp:Transcript_32088/g.90990  ORF Transcript_32088/g.90990 Transcript_32088/m.90990 type:complete len:204 (-) Transcript_32088:186-797(-)
MGVLRVLVSARLGTPALCTFWKARDVAVLCALMGVATVCRSRFMKTFIILLGQELCPVRQRLPCSSTGTPGMLLPQAVCEVHSVAVEPRCSGICHLRTTAWAQPAIWSRVLFMSLGIAEIHNYRSDVFAFPYRIHLQNRLLLTTHSAIKLVALLYLLHLEAAAAEAPHRLVVWHLALDCGSGQLFTGVGTLEWQDCSSMHSAS